MPSQGGSNTSDLGQLGLSGVPVQCRIEELHDNSQRVVTTTTRTKFDYFLLA